MPQSIKNVMLKEWYLYKSGRLLATVIGRLRALWYSPLWFAFKIRNAKLDAPLPAPDPLLPASIDRDGVFAKLFSKPSVRSFLEIGIGRNPNMERISAMRENGVAYVGCDFQWVCDSHQRELVKSGMFDGSTRFITNTTGSYVWTLFESLQAGERYDVVYLDGHHTMYIDLPAALLGDQLLSPGGFLVLDDVRWTLGFLKGSLKRYFGEWYFYRGVYDFEQYTESQQNQAHIGMIARDILIKRLGYKLRDDLSCCDWWVLQKP